MDLSISTSDKVRSRIRDLPAYIRVCMVSTLLWGILAHGIALVTKFSMADEAHYLFSVGATATSRIKIYYIEIFRKLMCF